MLLIADKSELTHEEFSLLEDVVTRLQTAYAARSPPCVLDEEQLCWICYAQPRSVVFAPCGHSSCERCIAQQLMTERCCFFCKAPVLSVQQLVRL